MVMLPGSHILALNGTGLKKLVLQRESVRGISIQKTAGGRAPLHDCSLNISTFSLPLLYLLGVRRTASTETYAHCRRYG